MGIETRADKDWFQPVDLMVMNPIFGATDMLVGRKAAMRAGGCDTVLRGNIGDTSEVLADYLERTEQITIDWSRMRRNWLRVWDKLDVAGLLFSSRDFDRAYGRNALYRSTIAYQAGNHAGARRLVAETWRYDLRFAATNPLAQIRSLAVGAIPFAEQAHKALRRRSNAAWTWFRG